MTKRVDRINLSQLPTNARLDMLLAQTLKLPRSQVRGLFDHDCVQLDGRPVATPGTLRGEHRLLTVSWDPAHKLSPLEGGWSRRPFHVLYEDRDIIVVEKNAGLLTVPTPKNERETLVNWIADWFKRTKQRNVRPWVVHRLDRDTSGILVFAKHEKAREALIAQFKDRKPERIYFAIVAGILTDKTGAIRSHLIQDKFHNQHSSRKEDRGLLAVTHYRVQTELTDATLIEVTLETGRKNQIRVHFAERGHPVLGDSRYQSQKAAHPRWPHKRLALHAASLQLRHPHSQKDLMFESPAPAEFTTFLNDVGFNECVFRREKT